MANGTVADIVNEAMSSRRNLADLEHQLQDEIDEIDFAAFTAKRPLTDDEKARRSQRRAAQAETRDAFTTLAFVTLKRLDETDEVKRLASDLRSINLGLSDDLARLKAIQKYAQLAAKVADGLAKLAEQVAAKMV